MVQNSGAELAAVCRQQFERHYELAAQRYFFAPGRINIIGEHIDYNGGKVFPCAISLGTAAAVAPRGDRLLRLYSHNFKESGPQTFAMAGDKLTYRAEQGWCNYVLGMVEVLRQEGMELPCGLDIVFFGNLPSGGSGLSSSASIEVLTGYILQSYSALELSRERLATLAQKAENEFCDMRCGIMDQFIIAVAQAKKACYLDCATLNYEQIPLRLGTSAFLIANTKLPRKLQESRYNERRSECAAALKILQQAPDFRNISQLCGISETDLPRALDFLADSAKLQNRVRHAVTENSRTRAAAAAMRAGAWAQLGKLLTASHRSLQNDYEVSGPHLDSLVSLLESENAVLGARMTGAGFGGCCIALLQLGGDAAADQALLKPMQQRIASAYRQQFGWEPEFYLSDATGGVAEIQI